MVEANERLMYEHLGENALAYLLASDVETLHKRFGDTESISLSAEREEVLAQLIVIDEQMVNLPHESLRAHEWVCQLAHPITLTPLSNGNLFRQISGGEISQVPMDLGPLETILARLTINVYPGLLVRESDISFHNTGLSIALFRHPLNEMFQTLILEDSELVALFTDESEHAGRGGSTRRSTGQGGTHQLSMFVNNLIAAGWSAALLDYVLPNTDDVVQAVLNALHAIRAAIKGEEAFVSARVGLAGVLFPEGRNELDLGWAKIRRADKRDIRHVKLVSPKGQLQTTTSNGNTITINYGGDLVVEFKVPYIVKMETLDFRTEWPEELTVWNKQFENFTQNIRLGLILACPNLRPILVTTWQVIVDPFSPGNGTGWTDVSRTPGLVPTLLTEEQTKEWGDWAKKVEENRIPSIDVAIRRMLMAIAERRTPEDVLVDAVIVWENLFGAKSETTFRISSSLAWLLGDSKEDRLDRQANYRKIYGLRSDVVHGASKVDASKLQTVSSEAVQISIDAIRAVLGEHAELLAHKTSEERSLHVLHAG